MKRVLTAVISIATVGVLAACGSGPAPGGEASAGGQLTMGFSQVGAESGWRTANTTSIQDAAKAADVDLKFSDANGEQENQISAIRSFVQQRVDVIAFSPVVRTGWDAVLLEAKNAGIPVILTDRAVDTQEKDVYKTFLGADFVQEGQRAGDWVVKQYAAAPGPVNIVQLEGTTGSDPALERSSGFSEAIAAEPQPQGDRLAERRLHPLRRQAGDGGVPEGQPEDRRGVRAERRHGARCDGGHRSGRPQAGQDIKIVAIDATHDGMQALADGKFNFIVECNPLLGPQLMDLAKKVVAGESVPARVVTPDQTFDQQQAAAALPDRKY